MFLRLSIVLVLGYLARVNAQSTQKPVISFCSGDVCYTRPNTAVQGNWTEAQERCKVLNATLPIVDNPQHQRSFEEAVLHFTSINERNLGIWIGAKASTSQPQEWMWLDGNKYSGPDIGSQGGYERRYAYVSNSTNGVIAYASPPTISYFYICHYPTPAGVCVNGTEKIAFNVENRCFVKFYEPLSWFNARNRCLADGGDLASFNQLAHLDEQIDSTGFWIGLVKAQWKWQHGATGLSSDVTFTLWRSGQPNDDVPTCISTDTHEDFPTWRDYDCSYVLPFICQVNSTTPSVTPPASTSSQTPINPGASLSSSITKNSVNTAKAVSPTENNLRNNTSSVNIPLAVGLGVGIGVPVIILIIVVIIIIVVRSKRQNSNTNGTSMPRKIVAKENCQISSVGETPELDETANVDPSTLYAPVLKNKSKHTTTDDQSRVEEASTNYASVIEVKGLQPNSQDNSLSSIQGPVYADLDFGQSSS